MLNKLEKALGYKFRDPELLRMALTHTSCANEIYQDPLRSYERLEFLGDSIVGFVTAEYLYRTFPKKLEGDLTRIRAELVCEKSLAAVAERLSLGEHLLLGNGEDQSGGRRRPSILCDVMEAVVAAGYLDGGFAVASDIVTRLILPQLAEAEKTHDYKTELQELVQRKKSQQLSYELISETGPDHCKEFNVHVLRAKSAPSRQRRRRPLCGSSRNRNKTIGTTGGSRWSQFCFIACVRGSSGAWRWPAP